MPPYNLRPRSRLNPSVSNIFDPQSFQEDGNYSDSEDSEDSTNFFGPNRPIWNDEFVVPKNHKQYRKKVRDHSESSDESSVEHVNRTKKRRCKKVDSLALPRKSFKDSDQTLRNRLPVIPIGDRFFEMVDEDEDEYDPNESWKNDLDKEEISHIESKLKKIRKNISRNNPTIPQIIQSRMTHYEKERAIQMYDALQNMDSCTNEYIVMRRELIEMIQTAGMGTDSNRVRTLRRGRSRNYRDLNTPAVELNKQLSSLRTKIKSEIPTLNKILTAQLPSSDKIRGIQLYEQLHQIVYGTPEWYSTQRNIQNLLKLSLSTPSEVQMIEAQEKRCEKTSFNFNLDIRMKILSLDASDIIITQLYDLYLTWTNMTQDDSGYSTLREKLNWFVQLPYRKMMVTKNFDDPRQYCLEIYSNLNKEIYGMNEAKERLVQIINNRIYGDDTRSTIAFKGNPGVGKTKLAKSLANAVGLPFDKISLGGAIDSTIFRGSDSVWVGSSPSSILQALARTKYANPIILLDEIDKLVSDRGGYDVQNSLLHILDYTQSKEFKDAYLREFSHDISNIWFVVTMNDDSELDPALRDRLDIIEIPSYTRFELKEIIRRHTLPDALTGIGLENGQIIFTENAIDRLLQTLSKDIETTGVRPIEKAINTIISRINLFRSIKEDDLQLTYCVPHFTGFPYTVTEENIGKIYPPPSINVSYAHMYI